MKLTSIKTQEPDEFICQRIFRHTMEYVTTRGSLGTYGLITYCVKNEEITS